MHIFLLNPSLLKSKSIWLKLPKIFHKNYCDKIKSIDETNQCFGFIFENDVLKYFLRADQSLSISSHTHKGAHCSQRTDSCEI